MNGEHDCNQGATLSIICSKIENIEKVISEVKKNQESDLKDVRNTQRMFMEEIKCILIQNAKYPSCEDMEEALKKSARHDTYFSIIWVALGGAWTLILLVLGVVIQRLF